jgi:hypothetical protein
MLQDFLAGRPSVVSEHAPTPGTSLPESGFQSLLNVRGGKHPSNGVPRRVGESATGETLEAPQIEVEQENGVVRRIVVTCTCCQRIELECEY